MSRATQAWTDFFVVLTFVANATVLLALVAGTLSLVSSSARAGLGRVVGVVGPVALPVAFAVAATATWGSLYYSEFAGFTPCVLCWYQRILMYPLVVILGVSWYRRDRGVRLLALPFVVLGAAVSTYHVLVERYPSLAEGLECSLEAPCTVPWFTEYGFVTIAYMALSGFLLVGTLLLVDLAYEHSSPEPEGGATIGERKGR